MVWQMKIGDVTFTVVDVETTGSNPGLARVIEVGAVKISQGKIVDTFHSLTNPGQRIPFFISWMTGISNSMVKNAPPFFTFAEEFRNFLQGTVFVAHNAQFDYEFIKTEFIRAEYPVLLNPMLCTIKLARRIFPGFTHYNLRDLSRNLGIPLERAHRALDDCLATAKILLLMLEKLTSFGLNDLTDLERIYQLSPQECSELFAKGIFSNQENLVLMPQK